MKVILNTDPSAPPHMATGASIGIDRVSGISCVSIDSWLLGPSEVMVLGNKAAITGGNGSGLPCE
jgi:hypothetical protein